MIDFFRSISLDRFCDLLAYLVSVLGTVISFVLARKERKASALAEILREVPTFITQIESLFPCGAGAVKLGYVLNEIRKRCESSHIKFDKSYWTEEIEKVLISPEASHYKKGGIYEEKSNEESQR